LAEHRRRSGYLRASGRKSSKSGAFRTGKIIPQQSSSRRRNECNHSAIETVSAPEPNGSCTMYIGLGGILILILILWLLGVI
jgi:hypothetical protein